MTDMIKKILALAALAIAFIAVITYFGNVDTMSLAEMEIEKARAQTIADLAYNYKGVLSRPIFPDFSLYLPLIVQVVISCIIIALMVVTSLFFPKARNWVMILTAISTVRHLAWRGVETLDLTSPMSVIITLTIYGAELLAFISMGLGYFQMWGSTNRKSVPLDKYSNEQLPSVDVYLCTYNEPASVIYRSLVGCQSIEYPKKQVYLLDDGNRAEMRELATRLGVNYVNRENNEHAKAGNLNNAMKITQGDLVVVFDADHVPCKTFLTETVGFFLTNDKLAFVQTPQHFFTQDPFQRNLVASRRLNNEQDLFFHIIEPGNDYWDSTFFGGTGAIFRRDALNSIGGFATETITEDVHTGLRLHGEGWKSFFYNRDLSAGMSQDSFGDFIGQRLRWTRGMTQILFFDHPMFTKGLSIPQRLCYMSGIWYFFHGLPRIIFLIAPLFFLLFGYKTINAGFAEALIYYLPSFVCMTLGYSIITKGIRQSFWSEVYETAGCIYLFLSNIGTLLSPTRAKFKVTPKGTVSDRMSFNWRVVFPQLMVAALTIVGLGMAIMRGIYTPEYAGGIYTNMFWSGYNLILLLGAIYVAQERPQFRLAPRIFRRIRCETKLYDGSIAVGYTTNISESGLAVVFNEPVPITGTVQVKLMDWEINETTIVECQAIRSSLNEQNQHYIGFKVVNRSDEQHQKLVRHMFGSADIWQNDYTFRQTSNSFMDLMLTPFRLTGTLERALRRKAPRFQVNMSCVLSVDGRFIIGFADDVSESGISILVKKKENLQMGQQTRVRIQWPSNNVTEVDGEVVRLEDVGNGQVRTGLNFVNLSSQQHMELVKNIYRPVDNLVRVAPSVNKMLRCEVRRQNGETLKAITQEISEMGLIVDLQDKAKLNPEESIELAIYWDNDNAPENANNGASVYQAKIKDLQAYGNSLLALVYFEGMNISAMDEISKNLHEPSQVKNFDALIG